MFDIDKRYIGAAVALAIILSFGCGMRYEKIRSQSAADAKLVLEEAGSQDKTPGPEQSRAIKVYVTGAVVNPGVYQLDGDARVYEAVEMAQPLPEANLRNINMARKLEDGLAIIVPLQGEEDVISLNSGVSTIDNSVGIVKTGKVNINSATVQELDNLPGIGPTLAQRIVDYRNAHGPFANIEGLNEVSGIGDQKFADLRDSITVR